MFIYSYLSICLFLCVHMDTSVSTCVSICVHMYMSVCICLRLCLHMSVCVYVCICLCLCVHMWMYVSMCSYVHAYTSICLCGLYREMVNGAVYRGSIFVHCWFKWQRNDTWFSYVIRMIMGLLLFTFALYMLYSSQPRCFRRFVIIALTSLVITGRYSHAYIKQLDRQQ